MSRSLEEWINHWLNCHQLGIDLGLTRIDQVWKKLGSPKLAKKDVITVAGTNGKGSSVKMLALILAEKGFRVGTFTSPHIHRFNERITFYEDNMLSQVTDVALNRSFQKIEQARGDITLSYFEASALCALLCFAEILPDVTILEVGLGGRLDAVNIIDADATLITSIGIDHEAYLGSEIDIISREKAGVMRSGQISVFSSPKVPDAIRGEARKIDAKLTFCDEDFSVNNRLVNLKKMSFTLPDNFVQLGQHQHENASGALELLSRLGYVNETDGELLQRALSGFALSGRFEVVSTAPLIVLDVAHNEDSIRALKSTLGNYPCSGNRIAVVAMLVDKSHDKVFTNVADVFDEWHLATLTGERGFEASQLRDELLAIKPDADILTYQSVEDAIKYVKTKLTANDQLIIYGSFITIEQAQVYLNGKSTTLA